MPFLRAIGGALKSRCNQKDIVPVNRYEGFQSNGAVVLRDRRRGTVKAEIPMSKRRASSESATDANIRSTEGNFFCLDIFLFGKCGSSRWPSRIRARSNSAKAPISDRSSVDMGEESPVNVSPPLRTRLLRHAR